MSLGQFKANSESFHVVLHSVTVELVVTVTKTMKMSVILLFVQLGDLLSGVIMF